MNAEYRNMISGKLYDSAEPALRSMRHRARMLCRLLADSRVQEEALRADIVGELFGAAGQSVRIEPPFFCDYGTHIALGDRVFINFNCVFLDPAPITIGSDVLFGPAVQIYTATHPLRASVRRSGREYALPVTIGADVWIGGAAVICPGVTIGDRAVIGAGSVVTRDIEPGVVAAGNPCRTLRAIEPWSDT
jgi:maltose O-acetyltransferase